MFNLMLKHYPQLMMKMALENSMHNQHQNLGCLDHNLLDHAQLVSWDHKLLLQEEMELQIKPKPLERNNGKPGLKT
jgi:hypothetical protein